jgi:hypothetical protein
MTGDRNLGWRAVENQQIRKDKGLLGVVGSNPPMMLKICSL